MANKKKNQKSQGVRGPSGPAFSQGHKPTPPKLSSNPRRAAFEARSYPVLAVVTSMPRWILIIGLGSALLLGMILSGPWAPLGALFLLFLAGFLGWLLALSWPLLTTGRALIRVIVVVALVGLAGLKLGGSF